MHLRIRTNTIASICRIRNALAFATHLFFQKNGFQYVHTPIITANDCEGAGEMFEVSCLLSKAQKRLEDPPMTEEKVKELEIQASQQEEAAEGAKKVLPVLESALI